MLNFNFKFGFTIIGFCPGIEHWKLKVDNWKLRQWAHNKRSELLLFQFSNSIFIFQLLAFSQELKIESWKLKIENWGNEQTTNDS